MGCSDCGLKGGCSDRKGRERELLQTLLPAIYPGGRLGEADALACVRGGAPAREGRRPARRAAAVLQAPTFFREGGEDELCDYIYVLCVGRAPGLVELREAQELDVLDGEHIRERYLRVAL